LINKRLQTVITTVFCGALGDRKKPGGEDYYLLFITSRDIRVCSVVIEGMSSSSSNNNSPSKDNQMEVCFVYDDEVGEEETDGLDVGY
jgi:hypothetical protein